MQPLLITTGKEVAPLLQSMDKEQIFLVRAFYPTHTSSTDLLQRLPKRSWMYIVSWASRLGVRHQLPAAVRCEFPQAVCWADVITFDDIIAAKQLIGEAIEVCTREKKKLHGIWLAPASLAGLQAIDDLDALEPVLQVT